MGEYSKERKYFLKLPKEFFNSYYVKILEGMPNGSAYLLMYLKLMCESISHGGYLRFSEEVPYTPEMVASVTNTNLDMVKCGLEALGKLGLVKTTPGNSLYLPKVEEMTESTTRGAERMMEYRKKHGEGNKRITNVTQVYANCNTDIDNRSKKLDIELDLDKDLDKELDLDIEKDSKGKDSKAGNDCFMPKEGIDLTEQVMDYNQGKAWKERYHVEDGKAVRNQWKEEDDDDKPF